MSGWRETHFSLPCYNVLSFLDSQITQRENGPAGAAERVGDERCRHRTGPVFSFNSSRPKLGPQCNVPALRGRNFAHPLRESLSDCRSDKFQDHQPQCLRPLLWNGLLKLRCDSIVELLQFIRRRIHFGLQIFPALVACRSQFLQFLIGGLLFLLQFLQLLIEFLFSVPF